MPLLFFGGRGGVRQITEKSRPSVSKRRKQLNIISNGEKEHLRRCPSTLEINYSN